MSHHKPSALILHLADQYLHRRMDNVFEWLIKYVPKNWQDWMARTNFRDMVATFGSSLVSYKLIDQNSPWGRLINTALNGLVAEMEDYFKDYSPDQIPQSVSALPAQLVTKMDTRIKQATVSTTIQFGMLNLPAEDASKISLWLVELQREDGDEALCKAIQMMNGLSLKQLTAFSTLDLEAKTAYFKGATYQVPQKKKRKKASWIERQRKALKRINQDLDGLLLEGGVNA